MGTVFEARVETRFARRVLGLMGAVLWTVALAAPAAGGGVADDGAEPPANPFLADSPWPMSHRNPYNQASSPHPGPDGSVPLTVSAALKGPGPITLNFTAPYPDGRRAVWGANFFNTFKALLTDAGPVQVGNLFDPPIDNLISGAYTVLDAEGTFFVPKGREIRAYVDVRPDDAASPIRRARTFFVPAEALRAGDAIVGMNLTYDGRIAFATGRGTVGVVTRAFDEFHYAFLSEVLEEVSNSIAVDEDGGIYVVTSEKMHRVQWTGAGLSTDAADGAWSAPYDGGPPTPAPGRLGVGSGTTPTLMGTGDEDKFVVIADGADLMKIVLFWRDEIPADWVPIAPGRDPRIAAEVPITFGDPAATRSVTEQSITVRGHDAMVVSNTYRNWPFTGGLFGLLVVFASGNPDIQPYGVEKFRWDPASRTLRSEWANPDLSCPNGIPSMSAATGLGYCIGARAGVWTLEGIDWATGEAVFHAPAGAHRSFNSLYAATEIAPGGAVATGTLGGPLFLTPPVAP